MGRSAEALAPGLRRFEHCAHAVFYAEDKGGILIVRSLWQLAGASPSHTLRQNGDVRIESAGTDFFNGRRGAISEPCPGAPSRMRAECASFPSLHLEFAGGTD